MGIVLLSRGLPLNKIKNAIAAYALVKLSTKATKCIRIRRDNDNAELDIGFVGTALDTASITAFVGTNSAYVTTWYNQVNIGRDAIQTVAGDQPRIVNAGTIDSGLVFDGANSYLKVTYHASLDLGTSNNLCFASIFKTSSTTTGKRLLSTRGDTTKGIEVYVSDTNAAETAYFFGADSYTQGIASSSANINDGNNKMLVYNYDRSGNIDIRVNNVTRGTKAISTRTGSANSTKDWYIGRYGGSDIAQFDGTMYQLVIFNKLLSQNELDYFFMSGLSKYSLPLVPLDALAVKVQSDVSEDNLTFGLMTDSHISLPGNAEWSHFDNLKSFATRGLLDFISHMGDAISGISTAKTGAITFLNGIAEKFSVLPLPVLFASGNHDDNSYSTSGAAETAVLSKQDWHTAVIQPFNNGIVGDPDDQYARYFYRDFAQQKVRVITLDTNDYPVEITGGNYTYYGANDGTSWGVGNQQLNWLVNHALNLPLSDWAVIFIAHMPTRASLSWNNIGLNNGDHLEEIIKAFNAGETYTATAEGAWEVTIDADFTSQGARETIAYFHGHIHADNVQKPVDLGWNYIATACNLATVASTGLPSGAVAPTPRTAGSDNQDCWDVVTINRGLKKIKIRRYGAGSDREIDY